MQFFSAHTGIIIKSVSPWICAAVALIAITATAAYNFVFEQINGIRITRADFILRKDSLYAVKCVFIYKSRKYIVVNTVVIACYSYVFFVVKNFEYSIFNKSFSVI